MKIKITIDLDESSFMNMKQQLEAFDWAYCDMMRGIRECDPPLVVKQDSYIVES